MGWAGGVDWRKRKKNNKIKKGAERKWAWAREGNEKRKRKEGRRVGLG